MIYLISKSLPSRLPTKISSLLTIYMFELSSCGCIILNFSKLNFNFLFLPYSKFFVAFLFLHCCLPPFIMIRSSIFWYYFTEYSTKITTNYYARKYFNLLAVRNNFQAFVCFMIFHNSLTFNISLLKESGLLDRKP